jgi:hypothetical protein
MTDDFNKWWDEDVLVEDNPFTVGTSAYWAWEGWCAAVKAEREKAKHNEEVLMNALWKACGDDAQVVEATIESQGELK